MSRALHARVLRLESAVLDARAPQAVPVLFAWPGQPAPVVPAGQVAVVVQVRDMSEPKPAV